MVGMILNMYFHFGGTCIHLSVHVLGLFKNLLSVSSFPLLSLRRAAAFPPLGSSGSSYSWVLAVVNGALSHYILWLHVMCI